MSLGDVQAFIQYSRQFTQPLTQLASMVNVMQSGIASAERVFELLDVAGGVRGRREPAQRRPTRAAGSSSSTCRSPTTRTNPLIEDLSLVAEPGQTVAIVGPTGAGKTTLVNLHHAVLRARRRRDHASTATTSPRCAGATCASNIGMVLQDTWLFGGTIRENIAYGNLDATEEQILEAARATYVDRFVHSLPDGYDTMHRRRGRHA